MVSITNLTSGPNVVNGGSLAFAWAAPPVSVTVAEGQRVTGSAVAVLGTSSGAATHVGVSLCYQAPGGSMVSFQPGDYPTVASISARVVVPAAATIDYLEAGEYLVGFCARNTSATALDDNDGVNGWVMVTN